MTDINTIYKKQYIKRGNTKRFRKKIALWRGQKLESFRTCFKNHIFLDIITFKYKQVWLK